MKKIRYAFEGLFFGLMLFIFSALSARKASQLGGWIGKTLGPRLAASRKAYRHLNHALPNLPKDQQDAIIAGMWENLGKVMAEYPHLDYIARNNVEIIGLDKLKALRDDGKAAIMFGSHIGNWEIASPAFYTQNLYVDLVYRAPNNPWADKMLDRMRSIKGRFKTYPKSTAGTRNLVKALKDNRHIGILIDQKYNEGLPADFFGTPAMTSPAFVQLAQKFNCPLVPIDIKRIGLNNFTITVNDEIPVFTQNGTKRPVEDVIAQAHKHLESLIEKNPSQWLWLHRRWGKNV